ncbi:MAG: hypothetical protein ABR583_05160 [Gaiellaceae bacterium]
MSAALAGAERGVVAAMAMSGMRTVTMGLGFLPKSPPEEVAEEGMPGLLALVPPNLRETAIELAHWGFGATAGALHSWLPDRLRRTWWAGPAYGLATQVGFEAVVAPVLGLRTPAERSAGERVAVAADHVLFGLVVASRSQRP